MKIADQPAFPLSGDKHQSEIGKGVLSHDYKGITKREYFAAHAPERPFWFRIVSKINKPKEPKMWTDLPNDDPNKKELGAWMHDPCYDLPEELRWYQDAWEKYFKDMREYESLTERELYFSWRVYYADALLKQLES